MKLNEETLYLIKRDNGDYLIAYPLFDLNGDMCGWWDQNFVSQVYFKDEPIIASISDIERKFEHEN